MCVFIPRRASMCFRHFLWRLESSCSGKTMVAGMSFLIWLMKWKPVHTSSSSQPSDHAQGFHISTMQTFLLIFALLYQPGEHPVRFSGTICGEVINEDTNVSSRSVQYKWVLSSAMKSRIDTCHYALHDRVFYFIFLLHTYCIGMVWPSL